jgi:putative transposase
MQEFYNFMRLYYVEGVIFPDLAINTRRCTMPRGPRLIPECGLFHILIRGNNKRVVFLRDCEFRYFLQLLLKYKKRFGFTLHHYVLMKNHVHLSIKATRKTNISKLMQGLELSYNHYQRRRRGYSGHLWQGRFKSYIIENDEYFLASAIYIEKNPVEAGIVRDPAEYPWSSYRYYASGKMDDLIDPNPLYENLGLNPEERQKRYRELMYARISESQQNENVTSRSITLNCTRSYMQVKRPLYYA